MYHSDKLADLIVVEPLASPTLRLKKEADPFSLDALIAWLEKQDGKQTYNPDSITSCLMCRYASHVTRRAVEWSETGKLLKRVSGVQDFWWIAAYGKNDRGPFTFGAALQRALALRGAR